MSPALLVDSLRSEPAGKLKNTGVSSLSLLQGYFLTQESNWGLLHCRQILYQLSHWGSPCLCMLWKKKFFSFKKNLKSSMQTYSKYLETMRKKKKQKTHRLNLYYKMKHEFCFLVF